MSDTKTTAETPAAEGNGFGVNRWLVDELYEQYREDPDSLSPSWQEFFEDYRPEGEFAPPREREEAPAEEPSGDRVAGEEGAPEEPEEADAAGEEEAETAPEAEETEPAAERIRGIAATIAENMETSLGVPTATSVRTVPAKLLEVNRTIANNYLRRSYGGKISFTHIIAYAAIRALDVAPNMKSTFAEVDGNPARVPHEHVNLGLAVDQEKKGERTLLVPNIKQADTLDFNGFLEAYEDLIRKVRTNKLSMDDFADTTMTITNPGMIGTVLSVPRLMQDQSVILGVGAIDYPAEYQAADPKTIARLGVSKNITLTSTYDHRIIMGAESGEWLRRMHELLLGEEGFYDEIFEDLNIPYEPARWRQDRSPLDSESAMLEKQSRVNQLAHMYRVRGHLIADLDPLSQRPPSMHAELDPTTYGLSIWDLEREFVTNVGKHDADGDGTRSEHTMSLGDLLGVLRDAYCRTIGIEYMHIQDPGEKRWIQEHVEGVDWSPSPEDKRHVLERLNAAEAFERFLHTKYLGHKRFSLEGGESVIPLLDAVLDEASGAHMDEVVMGMAHRGRLNVLANILGKSYRDIFSEFEGDIDPTTVQGSGDVKYHVGQTGIFRARSGGEVRITMPSNPSHLEAVDPVVEGMARAKQDLIDEPETYRVLPLLVHGDAAFAGQGVVAEVFNLSQLRGYRVGGTVHVVINNQLGFTTGPEAARSSEYSTDIARAVQAPIFHVNGDDPEACIRVAQLAFAYRQQFHKDVVIDLVCYRKLGHNEADDPSYTQPLMYEKIQNKRSVRKIYTERLVKRGDMDMDEAEELLDDFQARLDEAFDKTKESQDEGTPVVREPGPPRGVLPPVETGVPMETLEKIVETIFDEPEGLRMHPKLKKQFDRARERFENGRVDWPLGEQFALGSLLLDGTTVRLAGEDSRRGTFSQRHAVLVDYDTGEEYFPLGDLDPDQGKFFIYDSLLSEYAALGFEYGYSVAHKDALTIWEAQFGDFINGAQVIVDEFLTAAEDKWGQKSGLVLLLPHGYEGQGPDHSSARIERFLTLAADDNIQLVNATTAAQYFHVLRRQKVREDVVRPLVIFTPKSLLRAQDSASHPEDFTSGHFRETIDDPRVEDRDEVTRLVLCSGKIAYEAMDRRDEEGHDAAVVRVEQLYPWPGEQLEEILESYSNVTEVVWLQEEPENMGAWPFAHGRLHRLLRDDYRLVHIARHESASPASGSHVVHEQEQEQLLRRVFANLD